MDRINSRSDFIPYLKKIHAFLMSTSILGDNFANYYLQAGESEDLEAHLRESTQHKLPSDFKDFLSMLTSCGEAPQENDFYLFAIGFLRCFVFSCKFFFFHHNIILGLRNSLSFIAFIDNFCALNF